MPIANVVLVLLIGLVLGVIASVALKSRGLTFFVNIAHGMLGGILAAMAPVLFSNALAIGISAPNYLLRALMGAFVMVLVASLFRPAKPRSLS